MDKKVKSIIGIITSLLVIFVISTGVLIGVACVKQRENDYNKKYLDLLVAIQYYDYYTMNTVSSLIGDLKTSKYYSSGIDFVKKIGYSTSTTRVYSSVKDIETTANEIRDLKSKTEWSQDKNERFYAFRDLLLIDDGYVGFKFTNEFYNGNEFSEGINLFTSLGNIEWSDDNGNKLQFVAEWDTSDSDMIGHCPQSDSVIIELNGKQIVSLSDKTSIEMANVMKEDSISIQCNKDTTAENFKILSLEYQSNAVWNMTIQEIISQDEINEYVLTATIE